MTDTPYIAAAYVVSLGIIFAYWCVIHAEARFLQRKEAGKAKTDEKKKQ